MLKNNEPNSSRDVFTNDRRNIETAAYMFGVEHMSAKDVARAMPCTQRQAAVLKLKAKAAGLVYGFNSKLVTDKAHLRYLETIGLAARLENVLHAKHHNFRELKIFDSGGKGQSEHDIELRLKQFSSDAAYWLRPLLKRANRIGVTWGTTIRLSGEQLLNSEASRPSHAIQVIPTCGEPLGTSAGTASSSRIACLFDKALNLHGKHSLSLAGTPAMIAQKFQTRGVMAVAREMLEESPAYIDIFKGRNSKPPLVEQIDTLLTSVATSTPLRMAGNELLEIASVDIKEWNYFVGDIGGVLLEKKGLNPTQKKRVIEIRELWTGIKIKDYERIANNARNAWPGVTVLAIDGNKCPAILRAIELGWVNRLACDRDLAEKIASEINVDISPPAASGIHV